MEIKSVDRTSELEQRLRAIKVNSEDTCAFWCRRADTLINLRHCFYCVSYYADADTTKNSGFCRYKQK